MTHSNDVAIVTGGTRGIGRSVVLKLADRGANVVATYHSDDDAAEELRSDLEASDQDTAVVKSDVSDPEQVAAFVSEAEEEFGQPTILVNNAGIMANGLGVRISPSDWDKVIRTNLSGAFYCSREVLKLMLRGTGGKVVNVSSVGALRGWAGQVNYAASKAGLVGMTRSLAREFGGKDINVNAVCPGYTDTDLLDDSRREDIAEEEDIPKNRVATAEEIAEPIVFLASDRASFINGSILRVDGGLLA